MTMKQIPVLGIIPGEDLTDREFCVFSLRTEMEDAIVNQETYEENEWLNNHFLVERKDYDRALCIYKETKDREFVIDFVNRIIQTNTFKEIEDKDYEKAVRDYKSALKQLNN